MSQRAIARSLRIGRKRIQKILLAQEAQRAEEHTALDVASARQRRASKLDPYRDKVQKLLATYADITAQRILEILRAADFDGGYSIVKELVCELRPKPAPTISLPTPLSGPGELAESDWAVYTIEFTHAPTRRLSCFNYVLRFSHRKYFSFHDRQDIHALMDGHVGAFRRFDGVAAACKYDNQKPVVLRWEGRQPIYNLRFVDFCTYYQYEPRACRPYRPNDKPRSERAFWELERSFLCGRSFRDEPDLARQLEDWLDTICDQRQPRDSRRTPLARFAEEKPHLRPLPAHPYDTARVVYRLCDAEGCIHWDGNFYEIPYEHVTEILPVRITATELHVYAADLSRVATYALLRRGAGLRAELPGRRPPWKKRGADLDQLRVAYEHMGSEASAFLAGLETAQPRSAGYHARKILTLRERFSTRDLVGALVHAQAYAAFEHGAVARILSAHAEPRPLDPYIVGATAQKLRSTFGDWNPPPPSLSDYDPIPGGRS
jgi:transposase